MKNLFVAVAGLLLANFPVQAQRPDLPGHLLLDVGLNVWNRSPVNLSLNTFESKTVNITYYYDLPLGNNGITFTPGIGVGLEKYSLKNNFTLTSFVDNSGVRSVQAEPLADIVDDFIKFGKSKIGMNYLDIPLEIRYYASKTQYNKGFRMAIGAKIGVLYSSFVKYKFEDRGGSRRMVKDRQNLGLNRFRYGVQARIGFGGFGLFGFYELSNKWQNAPQGGQNTKTLTIGISLTAF